MVSRYRLCAAAILCLTVACLGADCVSKNKELLITDLSVVNDARAVGPAGAWSFGALMTELAGNQNVSRFVSHWLSHWMSEQPVNGSTIPARVDILDKVIRPWKRAGGQDPDVPNDQWDVDLSRAPFRLLAIVNRLDLMPAVGDAGEGRFVFGVLDESGRPLQFTVIFEFRQRVTAGRTPRDWARQWHDLGSQGFGEAFNRKLEGITQQFAVRAALNQVRTNEIALDAPWELREFRLAANGMLSQGTVAQTPAKQFSETRPLVDFIQENKQDILASRHVVPAALGDGTPFLGGNSLVDFVWKGDATTESLVRHRFAFTTCNGCHSDETGTVFLHVSPREANAESNLSGFLKGITIADPVPPNEPRTFNDLEERQKHLLAVLSGDATPPSRLRLEAYAAGRASARVH